MCKPNLDDSKLRFFDFEADPKLGEHHVPNYAAVSSDGVQFKTYHNFGLSIIDKFVHGEFCDANRGCTYIAHNSRGYDCQFIKEALCRKGIKFEYIPNHNKIMQLTLRGLRIRVIDSANFVAAPLSDFPQMFSIGEARKGTYPYLFNTRENWNYVGDMPPLRLFLPHGGKGIDFHEGDEKEMFTKEEIDTDDTKKLKNSFYKIVRWWNEKVSEHYVWNNFKELEAYCKNDVFLLATGCLRFREIFRQVTTSSQWKTKAGRTVERSKCSCGCPSYFLNQFLFGF